MRKLTRTSVLAATAVVVTGLGGGIAAASSAAWPTAYPLPVHPGTVTAQTSTTATVRSTDAVYTVRSKLDQLYVAQKGCQLRLAVNRPKDYLCFNAATHKTDEVYFTFAALDPKPTDASRSQTNAFYVRG